MPNKSEAKQQIEALVRKFDALSAAERRGYNEANTRKDFIMPLFAALGWDTRDAREVSEEVRVGRTWADYAFKVDGTTRFFVEAKGANEDLERADFAAQSVSYAWSKGVPWAVLTNFAGLKLFNAEWEESKVERLRVLDLRYDQYAEYFDELWALSKASVKRDGIRKEFEPRGGAVRKRQPVGERLFGLFKEWRIELLNVFQHYNRDRGLTLGQIDEAVQRVLDRLIFMRTIEDRQIEEPFLLPLVRRRPPEVRKKRTGDDAWTSLKREFRRLDEVYDSNLFDEHLADTLAAEEIVFSKIISQLYWPDGAAFRFDFNAIEADVLGQVYEQYLGHVAETIKSDVKLGGQFVIPGFEPANPDTLELVTKRAKRKQQGIYYTPKYIVDYIVEQTLGRLLEERGGDRDFIDNLTVLDPACGSGSFLIAAYERLLDYYAGLKQLQGPEHLSQDERVEILTRHIYGVDLDPQAVEIARLNLVLRALKEPRLLPELDRNIVRGNSLISGDAETLEGYFGRDWRDKHPLNWEERFPEIMARGGFDVVIGNPPYVRVQNLLAKDKEFYSANFKTATANYDIYILFVEQGLALLNEHGLLGYILPNKFFQARYGRGLRQLIAENRSLSEVVDFGHEQVFEGATTYTCLLFLTRGGKSSSSYYRVQDLKKWQVNFEAWSGMVPADNVTADEWNFVIGEQALVFERLNSMPVTLADVSARIAQGIRTSANEVYVLDIQSQHEQAVRAVSASLNTTVELEPESVYPFLRGQDIRRYYISSAQQVVLYPYRLKDGIVELIAEDQLRQTFPKAYSYLLQNRHILENREGGRFQGEHWYVYGRAQNIDLVLLPKILVPDIANRASFALDESGTYALASGYGIVLKPNVQESLEYMLGLLNSRLLDFFLKQISTTMRGGYFRYFRQYIERLPIRRIDFESEDDRARYDAVVEAVESQIQLHKRLATLPDTDEKREVERQIEETDRQLDRLVYELYGLTEEEIAIVEAAVG